MDIIQFKQEWERRLNPKGIVFVQVRDGQFENVNHYLAADGFRKLGYQVKTFECLELLDATPENIVCGNVSTVRNALVQMKVYPPPLLKLPDTLRHFLFRRTWETTVVVVRSAVWQKASCLPIFVKPSFRHKAFDGCVVTLDEHTLRPLIGLNDYEPIEAQEVVSFHSEWRVFVLRGEIIHISKYAGNPLDVLCPVTLAMSVRDCWNDAPCAYAIDVGMMRKNPDQNWQPAVVEVNDAFALGAYGLSSIDYARMIEARWQEMTHQTDLSVGSCHAQ